MFVPQADGQPQCFGNIGGLFPIPHLCPVICISTRQQKRVLKAESLQSALDLCRVNGRACDGEGHMPHPR